MTAADITLAGLSESDHRAQLRKAVIASTVGTTIEWCDFLVIAGYIAIMAIGSIVATALMPDYTGRDISEEKA
jgi:hypothetical protein